MIAAVDDDEVFETPGDEEFVVVQKAQVTGSQERTFTRICKMSMEVALSFLCQPPISMRHAWTGYPYLADLVWRASLQRGRIGDDDLLVDDGFSAVDHRQRVGVFRGCFRDAVAFEGFAVNRQIARLGGTDPTGDKQRTFRHPKTRVERTLSKTAPLKGPGEALERFRADGLRSAECQRP